MVYRIPRVYCKRIKANSIHSRCSQEIFLEQATVSLEKRERTLHQRFEGRERARKRKALEATGEYRPAPTLPTLGWDLRGDNQH